MAKLFLPAAIYFLAMSTIAADADSVVSVILHEKSSVYHRGVSATPNRIGVGLTTLKVTNDSDLAQGFAIIPLKKNWTLSMRDARIHDYDYIPNGIGHLPSIAPGATNTVTLDLERGIYILTCNLRAPYLNGLWTELEVE